MCFFLNKGVGWEYCCLGKNYGVCDGSIVVMSSVICAVVIGHVLSDMFFVSYEFGTRTAWVK